MFAVNECRHGDTGFGTRTGRYLERQGLLVRDMNNSYLALGQVEETGLAEVLIYVWEVSRG